MTTRTPTAGTVTAAAAAQALRAAAEMSSNAPSLHADQPWRWHIAGPVAELYAVPGGAPAAGGPGRQLRVSCGAALEHARLAVAAAGWHVTAVPLPDPDRPDLIGRLRLTGRLQPGAETLELAAAIRWRRTDHRAYSSQPIPDVALAALCRAARYEQAELLAVTHPEHRVVLAVLAAWAERSTAGGGSGPDLPPGAGTGPSGGTTGPPPRTTTGNGVPPVPAGNGQQPPWCVLSTGSDTDTDQVRAGQALARILLTATSLGLASSIQPAAVEVSGVRGQIEHWLLGGCGHVQAVFRVGWPDPAAPLLPAPAREPARVLLEERAG
jgi:hypothetical protein